MTSLQLLTFLIIACTIVGPTTADRECKHAWTAYQLEHEVKLTDLCHGATEHVNADFWGDCCTHYLGLKCVERLIPECQEKTEDTIKSLEDHDLCENVQVDDCNSTASEHDEEATTVLLGDDAHSKVEPLGRAAWNQNAGVRKSSKANSRSEPRKSSKDNSRSQARTSSRRQTGGSATKPAAYNAFNGDRYNSKSNYDKHSPPTRGAKSSFTKSIKSSPRVEVERSPKKGMKMSMERVNENSQRRTENSQRGGNENPQSEGNENSQRRTENSQRGGTEYSHRGGTENSRREGNESPQRKGNESSQRRTSKTLSNRGVKSSSAKAFLSKNTERVRQDGRRTTREDKNRKTTGAKEWTKGIRGSKGGSGTSTTQKTVETSLTRGGILADPDSDHVIEGRSIAFAVKPALVTQVSYALVSTILLYLLKRPL